MKKKTRILVADDHNIVRQSIITMIETNPSMMVVAEAENGEKMIEEYFKHKPDVVLSDISMPHVNGLDAVKSLIAKDPDAKVIFLSIHNTDEYIYKSFIIGASGLIGKDILKGELFFAIETVAGGGKYFNGKSEEEVEKIKNLYRDKDISSAEEQVEQLTHREKEVLKALSLGLTSEEIADRLILSKRVVEVTRMNIMQKLGLKSFHHLIRFAVEFFYKENNQN
jgi:two-component system, NarL family, response regulator NreC